MDLLGNHGRSGWVPGCEALGCWRVLGRWMNRLHTGSRPALRSGLISTRTAAAPAKSPQPASSRPPLAIQREEHDAVDENETSPSRGQRDGRHRQREHRNIEHQDISPPKFVSEPRPQVKAEDADEQCDLNTATRCRDRSRILSSTAEQRGPKSLHPFRRSPSRDHWPRQCANGSKSAGSFGLHCDRSGIADAALPAAQPAYRDQISSRIGQCSCRTPSPTLLSLVRA